MRSEIGVHPWAKYFMPYLDGVELKDCRMADEEQGCAEVYQRDEKGSRRPEWGTRMLFGKIELRPLTDVARRIKANPERAAELYQDYYEETFGAMDRELAASGCPRR